MQVASDAYIINQKATWKFIALILLVTLALGIPTLIYPFGRDQGEYAWIATSTLNGNLSYSDIFNVKPPLTHVVHQVALLLFGHHMSSIRILDLVWQSTIAILTFVIAKQAGQGSIGSLIAPILYLFSYYSMGFWMTAQTDGFLTLPIAVAILLFLQLRQKNDPWLYIAIGIGIGLGVLFKYPIGILAIFLSILLIIRRKRNSILPILFMGIGFILPLVITILTMLVRGNLEDFLWTQFIYIPKYATITHQNLNIFHLSFLIVLIPSIVGCYGIFVRPSSARQEAMTVVAVWWFSAVLHFVVQNKFYDYHALPMLSPLALMVSSLFVDGIETKNRIPFTLGAFGAALMIIPFFLLNFPKQYIDVWNVISGNVRLSTIYSGPEYKGDGPSLGAEIKVAEYLNSHTEKNEKIFIWGFEPTIYFLAQRNNATRFAYNFLLYGPNAQPDLRQEFANEIQVQKPSYIVIVSNDSIFHVTGTEADSLAAFNSFNQFHNFVLENYNRETTIEDFTLYSLEK